MEAYDHRLMSCLRGGILATLLALGVSCAPSLWGDLGSAGLMVRGSFTLGVAAAVLVRIARPLAVARKRDIP